MTDQIFIGFNGLQSDAQTFAQLLTYEVNSYKLRENRDISPEAFGSLVRTKQYQHRWGPYFIEPVIAGLNKVLFRNLCDLEWWTVCECNGHHWRGSLRSEVRYIGHLRREPLRNLRSIVGVHCRRSFVATRITWSQNSSLRSFRNVSSLLSIEMHTVVGEELCILLLLTESLSEDWRHGWIKRLFSFSDVCTKQISFLFV